MATRRSPAGSSKKQVPGPFGGTLEVTREMAYTEKMYGALQRRYEETGIPITDQVRDFITDGLIKLGRQESAATANVISFTMPEPEQEQLLTLDAQTLDMRDKNSFASWIVRRVTYHGAEMVQKLMLTKSSTSATIEPAAPTVEEIEAGKRVIGARDEANRIRELNKKQNRKAA